MGILLSSLLSLLSRRSKKASKINESSLPEILVINVNPSLLFVYFLTEIAFTEQTINNRNMVVKRRRIRLWLTFRELKINSIQIFNTYSSASIAEIPCLRIF